MTRLATLDDVDRVTTLIVAAYRDYIPRLGRNPQPMDDNYTTFVAENQLWVMEHRDEISGVLVCQHNDDHTLMRTVAISPEQQRKGLGSQLMMHAEQLALGEGNTTLRLYTNEVMTGYVELYEGLGYSETHRSGPEGKQVVYMIKELNFDD